MQTQEKSFLLLKIPQMCAYLHTQKRVPQILRIKRLYYPVSYGSEKERKLLAQTLTVYLIITCIQTLRSSK